MNKDIAFEIEKRKRNPLSSARDIGIRKFQIEVVRVVQTDRKFQLREVIRDSYIFVVAFGFKPALVMTIIATVSIS